MKKYLPLILLGVGLLVFGGVFFFVRGRSKAGDDALAEETAPEVPLEKRPVTSLTPSDDGRWLTLMVDKIVIEAETMDYELLYKLPDGRTQGVPGTIKLAGQESIERELLLGSESSGKFRYDEGVENGTLTLRFRNEKGKLVAKFSTEFALLSGTDELSSVDGKFTYILDRKPKTGFFVVMDTFGLPEGYPDNISEGPFGVFGSTSGLEGEVDMGGGLLHTYISGDWEELESGSSDSLGIFVLTSD